MGAVPIRLRSTGPHPAAAFLAQKTDSFKAKEAVTGYRRAKAPDWLLRVAAMALGLACFVLVWQVVAKQGGRIPEPAAVWQAALKIFADPFYSKGPNDQGIGWNIFSSLKRVGIGFGMAALVGLPLGFMLGGWRLLSHLAAPIVALLRPVSPLAWLPIGLLLFKAAN